MSKQSPSFNPADQKSASGVQFESGLNQSLQNLALNADAERKARRLKNLTTAWRTWV